MIANSEMKPNRYLHLFRARRCANDIIGHLQGDGMIQITTYGHCTRYNATHAAMFRLNGSSVQVQCGRRWNTIFSSGRPLVSIQFYS